MDLDAGLPFEVADDRGLDEIGPVVDVEDLLGIAGRTICGGRGGPRGGGVSPRFQSRQPPEIRDIRAGIEREE
jgi:hypothetical protein